MHKTNQLCGEIKKNDVRAKEKRHNQSRTTFLVHMDHGENLDNLTNCVLQ